MPHKLSAESSRRLRRLFHKLLQIELNIEKMKQHLVCNPGFSVLKAFDLACRASGREDEIAPDELK